jgi:hypothetical protein
MKYSPSNLTIQTKRGKRGVRVEHRAIVRRTPKVDCAVPMPVPKPVMGPIATEVHAALRRSRFPREWFPQ